MSSSLERLGGRGLVAAVVLYSAPWANGQTYRYEAETGQRIGTVFSSAVSGYSGTGYVTGFDSGNDSDAVQLQVDVPDGLYELWVGYRSQHGQKGYRYRVDGEAGSGMFDPSSVFSVDRAGLFNVRGGTNTMRIEQYWGYYDVDYFEFRPFTPPQLTPVSPQLSDPQADEHAQYLMNYMTSIYGEKTLSGQQHEDAKGLAFPVQSYLNKSGGYIPAIRASDFMEYSPSRLQFGSNPRSESEMSIDWARQTGGVVTMSWHWNAPTDLINTTGKEWWRGFYTDATTFDVQAALAAPGSPKYNLLLRDIDAIAVELQKFETAGVPVIWRPLHEAQGGWFWWGAKGPDAFVDLWRLMHDRMTNVHGLHNLIWEFTSSAAEGDHLAWYPGDDVVDVVGLDVYTDASSSMSGQWYDVLEHYDGRKLIALSETGTLPNPDLMEQWGIDWSYFSPWNGTFVDAMTPAQLQATLGHEDVITVDELPMMPWSSGDFDDDGDVDGGDFLTWQRQFRATGDQAADANGDRTVNAKDAAIWGRWFGQGADGAPISGAVPEPSSVLLATVLGGLVCGRRLRRRSRFPSLRVIGVGDASYKLTE